jgi:hypothetical protein
MKPAFRLMLAGLLAVSFYPSFHASAQTWTRTSAANVSGNSIASSADGNKLFAVAVFGDIYSSTNAGLTWNPTGAPSNLWGAIACSADGSTLIAATTQEIPPPGAVLLSHDFGGTWTQAILPAYRWGSVACSADGNRLVAIGFTGTWPNTPTNLIYLSTDSGGSWAPSDAPNEPWRCVTSSADGTHLAATSPTGTWISTNGGLNWNPTTTPFAGQSVAVSADGNTLTVLTYGSAAVSHDCGATWLTNTSMPNWVGVGTPKVASSVNGTLLAALVPGTGLDIQASLSTNAGLSWSNSLVWSAGATNPCSIASSADGARLALAIDQFGIFTHVTTTAPVMNIASSADNIVLSWIVPSQNFVLQQSSDLFTWSGVGVTPVLNYSNLHYEVTVFRTDGQKFYRLASP